MISFARLLTFALASFTVVSAVALPPAYQRSTSDLAISTLSETLPTVPVVAHLYKRDTASGVCTALNGITKAAVSTVNVLKKWKLLNETTSKALMGAIDVGAKVANAAIKVLVKLQGKQVRRADENGQNIANIIGSVITNLITVLKVISDIPGLNIITAQVDTDIALVLKSLGALFDNIGALVAKGNPDAASILKSFGAGLTADALLL